MVTFCTGVRAGDTLMPMWCAAGAGAGCGPAWPQRRRSRALRPLRLGLPPAPPPARARPRACPRTLLSSPAHTHPPPTRPTRRCGTDYENEKSRSCSSYFNMLYEVRAPWWTRGARGSAGRTGRMAAGAAGPRAKRLFSALRRTPLPCAVRQGGHCRPVHPLDRPGRVPPLRQDRHRLHRPPRQVAGQARQGWHLRKRRPPGCGLPEAGVRAGRCASGRARGAGGRWRPRMLPCPPLPRSDAQRPPPRPCAASTSAARTACRRRCTAR